MADPPKSRSTGPRFEDGNGAGQVRTDTARPFDPRDGEIARLRRERDELRARERVAHAEAVEAQERLTLLARASRKFAASMRSAAAERQRHRRRIAAQYAMSRILAGAHDLGEAAPEMMRILGGQLGWDAGVLWTLSGHELRCEVVWCPSDGSQNPFEEACRRTNYSRGAGLPGRAWSSGEAVCAENLCEEDDPLGEAAAEAGLRGALAFPVRDGGLAGVFELLRAEELVVDGDLLQTAGLVGRQISQFVERRRAETERDRSLAREREARRELKGILESINDGFFALDRGWRLTYVNRRAERFLKRSRGQLLGRKLWEEFPWAVDSDAHGALHHAMEERETVGFETVLPDTGVWISGRAYPSAEGISVYFQGITERRRVEQALKESETRYRTLTANIPGAVFRANVDDHRPSMQLVSDRIEEITGYPAADFVDDRVRWYGDVVHPDDLSKNEEAVRRAMGRREPYAIEYRVLHADGEIRWVNERGSGAFSEDAELLWVDGAIFDITERKLAEEAQRSVAARDAFRVVLADALRPLADPGDVQVEAARVLGKQLGANRAFYLDVEPDGAYGAVHRDHADGVASIAGRVRLDDFGPAPAAAFRAGRVLAVDDVATVASLTKEERAAYDALDVAAYVGVPLVKGGRLEAILCVHQSKPRAWTAHEVALVEDTAERTWAAVERARAEADLRESETRLQLALGASEMGTFQWHVEKDRGEPDARMLALFGLPPDGTISLAQALAELIHPDDRAGYAEAVARATDPKGDGALRADIRVAHPDGSVRWLAITAQTSFGDAPRRAVLMSGVAADITGRKKAEEERERLHAHELTSRAQAEERRRLSRELHDRVAHDIALVHQSLELHEALQTSAPDKARTKIELARETVKEALHSTRNLSMELRQPDVRQGLEAALSNLLRDVVPSEVSSNISTSGDETRVSREARTQVFLILREAIRNALTHSGCRRIAVRLDVLPKEVVGSVEDDGRGFNAATSKRGGGIVAMRERATLVSAVLEISPARGGGTRVAVSVPLEER